MKEEWGPASYNTDISGHARLWRKFSILYVFKGTIDDNYCLVSFEEFLQQFKGIFRLVELDQRELSPD